MGDLPHDRISWREDCILPKLHKSSDLFLHSAVCGVDVLLSRYVAQNGKYYDFYVPVGMETLVYVSNVQKSASNSNNDEHILVYNVVELYKSLCGTTVPC